MDKNDNHDLELSTQENYDNSKKLLANKIGNFTPGKEADFIIIGPEALPYLRYRLSTADDIFETLFVLMTLGDNKNIEATYIYGSLAYKK